MLGVLIGAAVLGGIIALMQEGEFPGWFEMILCVLAASIPTFLLSLILPESLGLLAPVVGALCAAAAISATCGMTIGRSAVAAGLWLVAQIALVFGLTWLQS